MGGTRPDVGASEGVFEGRKDRVMEGVLEGAINTTLQALSFVERHQALWQNPAPY